MIDRPLMTAEQFLDSRFELPECGQWAELNAGKVQLFQPPDLDYGNTVLNLSQAFATYIQNAGPGYACFDLGLLMESSPDTIRFPAACYFLTGTRFSETDKSYTTTIPELVIELASTADRRQGMARRIEDYFAWGVSGIWVIDPAAEEVVVVDRTMEPRTLSATETLTHPALLPEFSVDVEQLFVEPSWWTA